MQFIGIRLGLGLGKLRYHTRTRGHIKYYKNCVLYLAWFIGTRLGLGKLRYRMGGSGGLPPGLGFGLGKLRYRTKNSYEKDVF